MEILRQPAIPENDIVERTLKVISGADRFNEWVFDTVKPYSNGRILEIGSGTGNISGFFLRDGYKVTLSDLSQPFCEKLRHEFSDNINLENVVNLDLVESEFDFKYQAYLNSFDTIIAINVIEHIIDDNLAIENCSKLLKNHGRLIIMVPSYQILYNGFDKSLGHYKRYTLKSASDILVSNSFRIIHRQYFNFIGLLGWFVSGNIQKNRSIPHNQMKFYNRFVPLFKLFDKLILKSSGLSTLVVGEKSALH
jgi:SAM-dependent methyltransferase